MRITQTTRKLIDALHRSGGVIEDPHGGAWLALGERAGLTRGMAGNMYAKRDAEAAGIMIDRSNAKRCRRVSLDYGNTVVQHLGYTPRRAGAPDARGHKSRAGNVLMDGRRTAILALHELGGEIANGLRIPAGTLGAASTIKSMDVDGVIERDINGKQTRRIALNYGHPHVVRTLTDAGIALPRLSREPEVPVAGTVEDLVTSSRVAQGLPPKVEDPETLRRVATILRPNFGPVIPAAPVSEPLRQAVTDGHPSTIDLRDVAGALGASLTRPAAVPQSPADGMAALGAPTSLTDAQAVGMSLLASLATTVGEWLMKAAPPQIVERVVEVPVEVPVEVERLVEVVVEKVVEVPVEPAVTLESAAAAGRAASVGHYQALAERAKKALDAEETARKAAERRLQASDAALREERSLREGVERNLQMVLRNARDAGLVEMLSEQELRDLDRHIREVPPGPTSRVAAAAMA